MRERGSSTVTVVAVCIGSTTAAEARACAHQCLCFSRVEVAAAPSVAALAQAVVDVAASTRETKSDEQIL